MEKSLKKNDKTPVQGFIRLNKRLTSQQEDFIILHFKKGSKK